MEELKKEVCANIRSCLLSTKDKCDLRQLRSDYRMLMGCEIPYKKLNFGTLEELLQTMDNLSISRGAGGAMYVSAMPTDKSSHLTDLIAKQKTAKKRRMPFRPHKRPVVYNNYPGGGNRWRPTNVNNKWKAVYQNPPRLAAVSHNQIVKVNPSPTTNNYSNNNNVNNGAIKDLRQILDLKRTVSFETSSSDSASSSTASSLAGGDSKLPPSDWSNQIERELETRSGLAGSDRLPHSDRTNRAHIMGALPRRNAPPALSPTTVQNLRNDAVAAADPNSRVWDTWSSSASSDDKRSTADSARDPFVPTGEPLVDLYNFTNLRKLPDPLFKTVSRKVKSRKYPLFDCKVEIGEYSYTTYPQDFPDDTQAKQHVARLALADLMPKYTKRKSLLISTDQDVLARIPLMVEKHYHGIWNWQLEADYADLYHEQLPLNWLQIVDTSAKVSVESFLDKYVLRYCKPEDIFQKGKRFSGGLVSEVSVPVNTVEIGEDGCLMAEVTCVVSAKEVWCRQIGTPESESFNRMITNFERTYSEKSQIPRAELLNEGSYCAAYFDQNWYRVKVFEVNENDVNCFFIDYGDEQLIRKEDIYQLRREFAKEKAQAFICRLAGLEELYEVSTHSEHLQNLVMKTVHMETDMIDDADQDTGAPISVVLYDPETSKSINQELIARITIESATPVLNKNGVTQAYVCHAESNGDVYVHIQSPGFEKLETLLAELETSVLENSHTLSMEPVTPRNDPDQLYFGRYKEDDHWYRIKILEWAPNGLYAQIYFVDYGNCDVIKVADETLYPLSELSDVIDRFPPQAVRVRMQLDSVPQNFVQMVNKLMPREQAVLLKVVEEDPEGIPVVQFFTRIGSNNELCFINQSIVFETQQEENNTKPPERLQKLRSLTKENVPSTGILKSPALPKVGGYFDVKIPTAVNPWNFFVQPYDSYSKLTQLMNSLQQTYRTVTHSPLQVDDVQPGRIYASKHEDGKWYRTSVMKVIHPGSISVFYCDFGYYDNLTLQQLIPLDPQFLDLPHQAIKAKLSGIKPKQSKWTMDDCKFFQKLVLRKSLVSILVSIEKDELYKCDNVLNLKLIDTSTETDVHINEVLIRKGIAVEDATTTPVVSNK